MVRVKSKKSQKPAKNWQSKLLLAIKITAVSFIALMYLAPYFNMNDQQAIVFYMFLLVVIWALIIMGIVYLGSRFLARGSKKK